MKVCLKCSFANPEAPNDELAECPKCGAIYSRVETALSAKRSSVARPLKPEPEAASSAPSVAAVPLESIRDKLAVVAGRFDTFVTGALGLVSSRLPPFPSESVRKRAAYIGAGVVALSVFLPFVRVPILGTINLIGRGTGWGLAFLAAACACAYIAYLGRYKQLACIAFAQLLLVLYVVLRVAFAFSSMPSAEGAGALGAAMASAAAASVQLEFGALILFVGVVLVLAASIGRHPAGTIES